MPNQIKIAFLQELTTRFGKPRKLGTSNSLFELGNGVARIYIRYSTVHERGQTFYGLRAEDLQFLEGFPSIICFLWDQQTEPLLVPYVEYEDVFSSLAPAADGQYKVQIYLHQDETEFYIARAGRYNVERHFGWDSLEALLSASTDDDASSFSHSQIQTVLGAIGAAKDFDVWIPVNDQAKLDWTITERFRCRGQTLFVSDQIDSVMKEIDVIWFQRGSNELRALFEVEHSTPIYSGLLRFNDIHLAMPNLRPRFSIVANDIRRSLFARQLGRPTFQMSGLGGLCTFFEYADVWGWYKRISKR